MKKNLEKRLLNLFYQNAFTDEGIELLLSGSNRPVAHKCLTNLHSGLVSSKIIDETRFDLIEEITIGKEFIKVQEFTENTKLVNGAEFHKQKLEIKTLSSIRKFSQPGTIRVYNQKHNANITDFIKFTEIKNEKLIGILGIILFYEKTEINPKRDIVISIDPGKKITFELNQRSITRNLYYKHELSFVRKNIVKDNLFISFVPEKKH